MERFTSNFEPYLAPDKDGVPSGNSERRPRKEKLNIGDQIRDYFISYSSDMQFDESVRETFPNAIAPRYEIAEQAERIVAEVVERNNKMSEIIASHEYKAVLTRQRDLRGSCAIGETDCIDGRIGNLHTAGPAIGITEEMAGKTDTYTSKMTGEIKLKSQTLEGAVEGRPFQDSPQLLQFLHAHGEVNQIPTEEPDEDLIEIKSNCGAMMKFQQEASERNEPFASSDLIAENFRLLEDSKQAITRTYNRAARDANQKELKTVAIRAVYDTKSQGIVLGYGDPKTPPLFTTDLTNLLEEDIKSHFSSADYDQRLQEPGSFRQGFTRIENFFHKEQLTTDIIEYLMEHPQVIDTIDDATHLYSELRGLTSEQVQALTFKVAKSMAFQYLTGLHRKELSSEHPFSNHQEQYMAITIDDGYGATVGQYDPEIQVFAANTATITSAVDHVKTIVTLMDHYNGAKPYILMISSGISEGNTSGDVLKQARATVGRTFNGIMQNDDIAQLARAGVIVPVPAIVTSRNNRVIEVPNLLR